MADVAFARKNDCPTPFDWQGKLAIPEDESFRFALLEATMRAWVDHREIERHCLIGRNDPDFDIKRIAGPTVGLAGGTLKSDFSTRLALCAQWHRNVNPLATERHWQYAVARRV
ncbi:hypothetical protein [Paraburkholderia sp. C35]|uniref:hypothetical protein n=1 Tax=Paraburkholderia sp. C35 TaxID=2126993 RepID=UPI0013A56062|nr:hypothetical protein [Paraburkholderia sp. C35]